MKEENKVYEKQEIIEKNRKLIEEICSAIQPFYEGGLKVTGGFGYWGAKNNDCPYSDEHVTIGHAYESKLYGQESLLKISCLRYRPTMRPEYYVRSFSNLGIDDIDDIDVLSIAVKIAKENGIDDFRLGDSDLEKKILGDF